MDKKELYKEALAQEYKYMYRALARMTSYHEKLTTDGFDLTDEDKVYINSIIDKVDQHFIKRITRWSKEARV